MNLNAYIGESRFIVSPGRPDAPLNLPPLTFGNVRPIQLRGWVRSQSGELVAEDLADYQITLLVGKSNSRPTLGFWQVTTTEGTSAPVASRASAPDVTEALRGAFGVVLVEGGNGSYIVTLVQPGVWALPTATFQGNTLSNVLVFQISPGTDSTTDVPGTPAQYRIEVLEVAPARIVPASWAAGDTTPANSFVQVSGKLWLLTLSALADNGFFTLVVDGVETDFINYDSGAYAITVALVAAGKTAEVVPDNQGGYWVKFAVAPAACTVGGNLVILPFSEGNLDLSSNGVRELLDGLQYTSVKLVVVLVKDGQTVTAASADVMLQMPVNQPATIVIDAPEMAGLTFAISDDQAYLQVYQNGVRIGDVALNAPSGADNLQVYNAGLLSFSAPISAP